MTESATTSSEPLVAEVERGAIRKFAAAVGETDPVFFDVAAAKQAGYRDILAPPTFVVTLPSGPIPGVQLPPAGNIHGEQDFTFAGPVVAGDRISVVRRLADRRSAEGRSGRMDIYTFETVGTHEHGAVAYSARQVIIVRPAPGEGA